MKNETSFSPEITEIVDIIAASAERAILKKAVLSKPIDKSVKRSVMTPKMISGRALLQTETFTIDNKALHTNTEQGDLVALREICASYMQINVITTAGDCEYKRSKGGKETVIGAGRIMRKSEGAEVADIGGNDKEKNYILDGSEPFLKLLGVSDANGRIHDKKRSKYRQINRFLEHIAEIEKYLPTADPLVICDLCCGKSYLSFAVYHYFANIRGRSVRMVGADLKKDVIEYCGGVARELGFDGLEFVCCDINEYKTDTPPSLVISLHACDVATDIVLRKATEWRAEVILSTPCCHHEMNHTLDCGELSFIAEHSMLRQKLCDAATDALRLKRLEAHGYECAALELIDPDETPKNIMLRGVLKKNMSIARKERAMAEYVRAKRFLCGENENVRF